MEQLSPVKKICISAVCIVLCLILPQAFHAVGLGSALSPMHIPVLLCGLVCGAGWGVICGIVGPVLSSVLTGMPSVVALTYMVPELAVYGLASGLAMKHIRTGKATADLYLSLSAAMLLGRIAGGIAQALFYTGGGEGFTLSLWASTYLLSAAPGIVCHLIVVPLLLRVLTKARLIPNRYALGV